MLLDRAKTFLWYEKNGFSESRKSSGSTNNFFVGDTVTYPTRYYDLVG